MLREGVDCGVSFFRPVLRRLCSALQCVAALCGILRRFAVPCGLSRSSRSCPSSAPLPADAQRGGARHVPNAVLDSSEVKGLIPVLGEADPVERHGRRVGQRPVKRRAGDGPPALLGLVVVHEDVEAVEGTALVEVRHVHEPADDLLRRQRQRHGAAVHADRQLAHELVARERRAQLLLVLQVAPELAVREAQALHALRAQREAQREAAARDEPPRHAHRGRAARAALRRGALGVRRRQLRLLDGREDGVPSAEDVAHRPRPSPETVKGGVENLCHERRPTEVGCRARAARSPECACPRVRLRR